MILPAITTTTNTWSQTVILTAITANLSHHQTGVVIDQVIINTVDSRWDRHELGPYPRARLSIDLINTLQWLVHCAHTTEPMASHSNSGGPTAFRQNPSIATAHSRPLRPKFPMGWSWVAPCLPKTPRPPSWSKHSHSGTRYHKLINEHTRLCVLTGPGQTRHNLP